MIIKSPPPLYYVKHINVTYLLCNHAVSQRLPRSLELPTRNEFCWSWRRAQHAKSCTSVARLRRSSSRTPGRLKFDEACKPVLARIFMHVHTFTCRLIVLHVACNWSNSQKSPRGWHCPPRQMMITAQLLLTVILIGTWMRPRDALGSSLSSTLLLCFFLALR